MSNFIKKINFGDGSTNSTLSNPTHLYNTPGNYTVPLTITDTDGDSAIVSTIVRVSAPEPKGLGIGAIIGIILGSLVFVGGAVAVFIIVRKK